MLKPPLELGASMSIQGVVPAATPATFVPERTLYGKGWKKI